MIRIGIVGCGRILAAHLRGYRLLREAGVDDFRITALCERSADDARMYVQRGEGPPQRPAVGTAPEDPLSIADEYLSDFQDDVEVEVYTDFRRMVAEAPIDAVNDFTSHAIHHQVAAVALEQGKDLLTEKPMAATVRAARQMCQLAESRGLVLGVFQNSRFAPSTRHLRWLFDSGKCGHVQMVLVGSVAARWAPDEICAQTPWRHRQIEGGGIGVDVGVHRFDLIRHIAGEIVDVEARTAVLEPVRVTRDADGRESQRVECDAEDTVAATFQTEGGAMGMMLVSVAGHGGPTMLGPGIVFYGSAGRASLADVTFDDQSTAALEALYEQGCDAAAKETHFPFGLKDSFALAQHDWLDAVRHRRPPQVSGREGLADLACAYAMLESAQAGRRVRVEDVLSGAICDYQRPIDDHFGID